MAKRTETVFLCDACEKTTASRYRDRWYSVAVGRPAQDDDTNSLGRTADACSSKCALVVAGIEIDKLNRSAP